MRRRFDMTIQITEELKKELIRKAFEMLQYSYTPYSHFKVGAGLLAANGEIYGGCNIENAGFSATNCAERTAFFKAVSEGVTEFLAIAIVGGAEGEVTDYCAPCGVCRQVMMEFCNPDTFVILVAKDEDDYKEMTLKEMLPLGFGPNNLRKS